MARYAILSNGKVTNLVEADEAFANSQGWVAATGGVSIGDLYVDNTFVKVLVSEGKKTVTPIQFKLLFTFAELVAIRNAVANDVILAEFYKIIDDPRLTEVDLTLRAVNDGVEYLVANGLITADRKNEILNGVLK